jgi:PAS domain S-box-containing protein
MAIPQDNDHRHQAMKLKGSLALRLTLYFIILTFIPIGIYSFFLHNIITQNYYSTGIHFLREQAEEVAMQYEGSGGIPSSGAEFPASINGEHFVFVINPQGTNVVHPDPSLVGTNVSEQLGEGFLGSLTPGQSGGGTVAGHNLLYGYSRVPGQDLIVIAVANLQDIRSPLADIRRLTILQFLTGILLTGILAGIIIWRVVGKPLIRITETAEQIGRGNLEAGIDPEEMQDELKQLAIILNKMRDQLRELIGGLQARIGELAQAQNSLKTSDEQTRAIFDAVNEAILVLDLKSGEIFDVNKKMMEMYGYSREEALGLRIGNLSSGELPFTPRYFKNFMKEAVQTGPQLFEWHAKGKEGNLFWAEVNMRRAVIAGKDRVLVAVREISERKRAEQVRTALYRISHSVQAAQNLNELFYLIHGIINDLMPAQNFYIALYDRVRDEFHYPYYVDQYDTTPAPHTPNRGLTSYVLRTGASLLASPEVFEKLVESGEVQMIGANSVDWLGAPLNIAEGVIGVIAVQTYTTTERLTDEDKDVLAFVSTQIAMAIERKQSEDALLESETRWRTLTENAPQIILLLDRSGNVLFGNRLLPGMETDNLQAHSFLDYVKKDENRLMVEKSLEEVFEKNKGISFEISMKGNGDSDIWYACNLAPFVNDGLVEMAILNASDITMRKDAEKSIQTLNEELEKRVLERTTQLASAVRELEAFSYSVSHDLRAPLRALDGYSRILEREYQSVLDEEGRGYIQYIRASTQQMGQLIDDLLTFARLGRHPLEKQQVDMKELVLRTLNEFSQDRNQRVMEIKVGELPPCKGDPSLLHQVWVNLISNSIKFTRNCEYAQIDIGFETKDGIVYFIKDNGTGFDMKYSDKLFEVFQRLHRPDEFEGTGVGLAIVERIVRRHGGRVWAKSNLGEGATFYFTINGEESEQTDGPGE